MIKSYGYLMSNPDRLPCPNCSKTLKNKESLRKHLSLKRCISLRSPTPSAIQLPLSQPVSLHISDQTQLVPLHTNQSLLVPTSLLEMINVMQLKISSLEADRLKTNQTTYNQNNMNVMCLTKHDDLFDLLTLQYTTKQALTFIKDCALSKLAGDCRLLEKVYLLEGRYPALMYANKSKSHYVYFNEKKERVLETNPKIIAKILADNVQRSYLKGAHYLKGPDGKPIYVSKNHATIPVIEEFDLQSINAHIYELDDDKYQKRLLTSIKIPFEADIAI